MNIGTIYAEATKGNKPDVSESKDNQAEKEANQQLHLQTKIDWIKASRTQEVFTELQKRVYDLEANARSLAVSFHVHGNHQQIIKTLIEASVLRDFIHTYSHATE